MPERINHATEAQRLLESARSASGEGLTGTLLAAHVHSNLALVEQQRIANVLALTKYGMEEAESALMVDTNGGDYVERAPNWVLHPDIAIALGIEG